MSKYVGGRIVPKHCGTWNSTKTYETLSVVLYADTGDSYMARKAVPKGVAITNTEYWAKSADYSAQLNDIKSTVQGLAEENAELKSQVAANVTASTDEDADYAAELVDARVDDEGLTHESVGDAIRSRIGELDETLFNSEESSYTNTGTAKTSAKTFALSFTEDVYLKTLCPQFTTTDDDASITGTFTWWVVTTDKDVIADSSSSDKATVTVAGTKHSASIGDIIEVNQKMTPQMVLIIIPDDTDTRIMYLSSGAELATARLCYISSDYSTAYGTGSSKWYFPGDFVIIEKSEVYAKASDLEDYAKTENLENALLSYAKTDDLDDYVERDGLYTSESEDATYDFTGSSNTTSGNYYGFNPKKAVYIKSLTPGFSDTTGTFFWSIATSLDDAIASGSTFTKTDWTEQDIGTAIELGQTLKPNQILIVHGNSDSILTCGGSGDSSDYFYTVNTGGKSSTSVTQFLTGYALSASAELVFTEETPIFATKEELEDYVKSDELDEAVKEVVDEEFADYVKTDELDDYVKRDEIFATTVTEETLSFDATNTSQSGWYYGISPLSDVYIKTITPVFSGEDGTFTWGVAETTDGEAITGTGVSLTMGEWTEQDIGTTIEFDGMLKPSQTLIIHGNSDSILMYYSKASSLFRMTGATNTTTVGQYLTFMFACEMVIQDTEETAVFASQEDHDTLQEEVDEVKEELASAAYNPNPLYGKKVVAIGDSMVQGHSISKSEGWLAKIAERNGMTYVNYGINGTFMTNKLYGTSAGVVDRYTEMDDDADYILVFAGTNDIRDAVTIGDEDSTDESEFYGALNTICPGLLSKYPSGKIGFITPHARKNLLERTETYVEAIETACKNYGGIPVFNNVKNGGLCFWNDEQVDALTLGDGYHYNAAGIEWFSWKYEAFLRSL